nr:MAG TPA: hypothetical protein [Caudoviricetes sp.]DAT33578.1 MAG TPA: hypothetical protein [Caudoviricetes sp.]
MSREPYPGHLDYNRVRRKNQGDTSHNIFSGFCKKRLDKSRKNCYNNGTN